MSKLRELLFQDQPLMDASPGKSSTTGQAEKPNQSQTQATSTTKLSLSELVLDRQQDKHLGEEGSRRRAYQELKSRIHTRLIENIDIRALIALDESEPLEAAIERTVHALISDEKLPLTAE